MQWDWGDGTSRRTPRTRSVEPGKSEIRRRYSVEHVFRQAGTYQVFFRLKQKDRVIAAISANVEVRPASATTLGNEVSVDRVTAELRPRPRTPA